MPALAALKTLRPHQWVKNSFVLAPLVFSKHLFDGAQAFRAGLAVAAFCALSGAVYAFNDVRDVAADRAHPIKCKRPIAAGQLSESAALWLAAVLALGSLVGALALGPLVAACAAGYLVVNLAYSLALKQIAYLDVSLIAAGFLLRVGAGGFAIGVPISIWLLACTGLLAALLGLGKRAHELRLSEFAGRDAATTRAALAGYRPGALRLILIVLAVATTVAYALYTRDSHTIAFFHTDALIFTLPFCVIGIGRFLMLASLRPKLSSPTDAMLRDPAFLLNICMWGGAVIYIIYGAR